MTNPTTTAPAREPDELTRAYRELNRLFQLHNLNRPAIKMTARGKSAAMMIRTATVAVVETMSLERSSLVPSAFVATAVRRALDLAAEAVEQTKKMTA